MVLAGHSGGYTGGMNDGVFVMPGVDKLNFSMVESGSKREENLELPRIGKRNQQIQLRNSSIKEIKRGLSEKPKANIFSGKFQMN